jgi:O-antigen/teichoic acid export membrane protein
MTGFGKVLRNSGYLLGFRLLSRILSTVFLVFAASRLAPASFGALSFTLVTLELVVTLIWASPGMVLVNSCACGMTGRS